MIENIPPKEVSFSDLICIFAMPYQSFACLFFATLRYVKIQTWQNFWQLFVPQIFQKFNL